MIRRLLFLAFLATHVPVAPTPPPSCKPVAPIDLDAQIVGDPGAPFGITAKATSKLGVPVELEILLPDGVAAPAGLRKTVSKVSELRLQATARDRSRREILVRATITQGGAKLTKVVPLVLFDGPSKALQSPVKTNSRGEALLEYSP